MGDQEHALPPGFVERRRYPRVQQLPLGLDDPGAGAVTRLDFQTADLPADEQFAAWQTQMSVVCDVLRPEGTAAGEGFPVDQRTWDLEGILLVQEKSPAMSFNRSADKVRMSPVDHWCISILHSGSSWTEVDGLVAENQPGMLHIRTLGLPFRGRKTATTGFHLVLPVDLFADLGGLPIYCNNVIIGGPRAVLLLDHLASLENNLHRLARRDLAGVRSRLRDMIFDTITPVIDRNSTDRATNVGLMTRARHFITEHLGSPDLTVEALCRELALSRTKLYELFESSGGVAHYIRRRRLLKAHERLSNPAEKHKIADIAFALGFDSAANFSRAFTQQFGYSPNHVRGASRGQSLTEGRAAEGGTSSSFAHLLRQLSA